MKLQMALIKPEEHFNNTNKTIHYPLNNANENGKMSLPSGSPHCGCRNGFRYVILLMTTMCLTSIGSNMIAFNFTMILMRRSNWENTSFPVNSSELIMINASAVHFEEDLRPPLVLNDTHVIPPTVLYTPTERSWLLYAVGIASIISTFPFSALYTRFGARYVFLGAGILSAVATGLLPLAAAHGMIPFLIVRFFQGFSYGANFAAFAYVCLRWASLREHGLFLSSMTSYTPLSVALTNPLAGFISSASTLGWPWVYYTLAAGCIAFSSIWLLFYSDHPDAHKCVSARERKIILKRKNTAEISGSGQMPYCAILSTKSVWLNAFADIVTSVFLITFLPIYVSKVLRYGVRETGVWSALPAFVQLPLRPMAGILSDKLRCISEVNKMRVFNTIALMVSGLFFALVGFVPDHMPFLAIIIMTLNMASVSANTGGFYKCATLSSRQYAHFVVAGIQFEKSITMFVAPLLSTFFITDESSRAQWRIVFIGMAVILCIANTFFLLMATDQPADFTKTLQKNDSQSGNDQNAVQHELSIRSHNKKL